MSYLETKYVNLLSSHLRNFKRKSSNLWNFSCVFCGDSLKNTRKARGYIYATPKGLLYTCHNCGLTTNVPKLLKHCNPLLHEEYVKEMLAEKYQPKKDRVDEWKEQWVKRTVEASLNLAPLLGLTSVNRLRDNHPCKIYVQQRMIPKEWYPKLYYCENFMEWTNTLIADKFSERALKHDEGRLIIPLISKDKKIFGYQGRSLKENIDKEGEKYYTIILDESQPKIFGLDRVDLSRRHYVLEGPIDAMFIPNSIATAGGGLYNASANAVFVFDNEPRNKDTCKKIQKTINLGYKVCIWPESQQEKDVNELILTGLSSEFIKTIIDEGVYEGMAAQVVFSEWRKR